MIGRLGGAWLPIYHGTIYHEENSIAGGLNRAAAGDFPSIDLDWQMTKRDPECPHCRQLRRMCLGHPINTHWPLPLLRDGFRDPKHQIGLFRRIDDMTLDQALRLDAGGYSMHTDTRMFREAAERDLKVAAEVKHPRFAHQTVMDRFVAAAEAESCTMRVMKLSDGSRPLDTIKAAKRAGARTIVIARAHIPDSWRPFIDYQRGPARYWR